MQEKMIKKVIVDKDTCIGCGSCNMIAPDAFELDSETGKSIAKEEAENTDPEKIKLALTSCPVQA